MALGLLTACAVPDVASDDTGDSATTPAATAACAAAGFEQTAWDGSGKTAAIDAVVPDATFTTTTGSLTLSTLWDDCVVVTLVPFVGSFEGDSLSELLQESPPYAVYVFFSRDDDPQADLDVFGKRLARAIRRQDDAWQEENAHRFHVVTDRADDHPILAATAPIQTDQFVIDSRQRLRDGGSFRTYNGEFVPALEMVRYPARWFAYERRLEDELARRGTDDDVLVVPWITEGHDQTDGGRFPIQLPPASEMARYDRVEIVVKETCDPEARFPIHYGLCPAWDVGHKVTLCDDEASCVSSEKQQLYRYVTGYHSGGWWTEDVTHGLPWFQQGGTRWMRTDRGDFVGTIELHFFDDGEVAPAEHVVDAHHLIDMGRAQWDAAHNDSFPSYTFTPPPGTVKVVMDARVQGGGNNQPSGCAEFCSHSHSIDVNGQTWRHTFEMKSTHDCAARVDDGVVAGQFGTWFLDRGSWCPGGPVERWRQDITEAVDLDGSNRIVWTGDFEGDLWPPGGGTTATVWLAFYGADGEATVAREAPETCEHPPTVVIRDLQRDHPDFRPIDTAWRALADGDGEKEAARGRVRGAVGTELVGGLPVLAWDEDALPFTTAASFATWWTDGEHAKTVDPAPGSVRRTRQGTYGFFRSNADTQAEWPLVDAEDGWGAEGVEHGHEGGTPVNSSFTVHLSGPFEHREGLTLRLASRSDLWVFLDGELVLDHGGFLGKGFDKVLLALDDFDLVAGETHELDVFAVGGRDGGSNPQLWLEHPACD